jgi:hypothetical protein
VHSSHAGARVLDQMGGGAVTAAMYAESSGASRLWWSMGSDGDGSKPYDSRLSRAGGGIVLSSVVLVAAERGTVYASCRAGDEVKSEWVRVRRSEGRLGKIRLLKY